MTGVASRVFARTLNRSRQGSRYTYGTLSLGIFSFGIVKHDTVTIDADPSGTLMSSSYSDRGGVAIATAAWAGSAPQLHYCDPWLGQFLGIRKQ